MDVWSPTQQDLVDAACWFDSDKIGGRAMTAFKREARWRQHRWAVDELTVQTFGTHPGRRSHPDIPPEDIPNGTKLSDMDAEAGNNFLTPEIYAVAKDRVAQKQEHETLDKVRLYRDLLSSMPMAFNLFAEASLPGNHVSRQALAIVLGVAADGPSDIVFEWSPARRSDKYTRDRTAFDVALRVGSTTEPRTARGDRDQVPRAFGTGDQAQCQQADQPEALQRPDGLPHRARGRRRRLRSRVEGQGS